MTYQDFFTSEEIHEISQHTIEQCRYDFNGGRAPLLRRLQRFLYDEGIKASKTKIDHHWKKSKSSIGAWPATLFNLILPLVTYGGGCDTSVVYSSNSSDVEVRTNLVMLTVLESGGGKSINHKYCQDVLTDVARNLEPTQLQRFITAKKNKVQKQDRVNVTECVQTIS